MIETVSTPVQTARDILANILSNDPSYTYNLESAGEYARQLTLLVTARRNGLEAAKRVLAAIKARKDSEIALLLSEDGEAAQDEQHSLQVVPSEILIPELPESARLPEGFLPHPCQNPLDDWFAQWDNSHLQHVSPWLAAHIAYSYERSPEGYVDFHTSTGLWALSTVAARRIYVPLAKRIYTPLAVALVARTSLFAKSVTAGVALDVLKAAGLGWLLGDDETTPQQLLADMSGKVPNNYGAMEDGLQKVVTQRVAMAGQLGWYYDEFNQFVDAMTRPGPMAEFAGLLRKLDNCPEEYTYSTRTHGKENIRQPYLSLLVSTNPANLRKHANRGGEFWNDGFWARFAFIAPHPHMWRTQTMDLGEKEVPEFLASKLRDWNTELGCPNCQITEIQDEKGKGTGRYEATRDPLTSHAITIDQDAYQAYVRYREALRSLIAGGSNQDLDGSYARLSDKAIRIAALIASLENQNRIDFAIWTLSQEITEMFRRNLHELYAQASCSQGEEANPLEEKLIEFLKSWGQPATVREVIRNASPQLRKLGSEQVEKLLKYLEKNGIVTLQKDGRKECYQLAQ